MNGKEKSESKTKSKTKSKSKTARCKSEGIGKEKTSREDGQESREKGRKKEGCAQGSSCSGFSATKQSSGPRIPVD